MWNSKSDGGLQNSLQELNVTSPIFQNWGFTCMLRIFTQQV